MFLRKTRLIEVLNLCLISVLSREITQVSQHRSQRQTKFSPLRLSGGQPAQHESNQGLRVSHVPQQEISLRSTEEFNDAGFLLLQQGNYDLAESYFQTALRQNPKYAPALCNYARLLVRRQQVPCRMAVQVMNMD
jgi:tetratricopeptide (TPR) repeat protein